MQCAPCAHVDMVPFSVVYRQDLTSKVPTAPFYVIVCLIICLEGIESV